MIGLSCTFVAMIDLYCLNGTGVRVSYGIHRSGKSDA